MKLGVYIASHNNPLFLRMTLLQLEAQTLQPDVVAIHENGHSEAAVKWACIDIIDRMKVKGVQFLYDHTPAGLAHPFFHYLPLKRLVESGCHLFTKMDHDDIFYEHHLEQLRMQLRWFDLAWIGHKEAEILILNHERYTYYPSVDFGKFNPLGGMSDCFMFNREVAEEYLKDMVARAGTNEADDWILSQHTLPKFAREGRTISSKPTACYVSHGRNDSTSHWVRQAPQELRK